MQSFRFSFRQILLFIGILFMWMSVARSENLETMDFSFLPSYEKVPGVYGTLTSTGSDTLHNMMALWAEAFQEIYPSVTFQIEGKGSSTAPPALIKGTAQIGPMSREMKATEIIAFEERYGYKPTRIIIAIDSLALFTHKDNPVEGLTLDQLDGLFSSTFHRNGASINTWGELGLGSDYARRRVSLFGRNSASGTYGFFKEFVLMEGDFRETVKEQPGTSAVVQGVAVDRYGLGYGGIGYRTSGVKSLAIAAEDGEFVKPTYENCLSGEYPLARFLYLYVNKPPNAPMDPLTLEFVRFIFSREGQEIVLKDGYYPVPAEAAGEFLAAVDH